MTTLDNRHEEEAKEADTDSLCTESMSEEEEESDEPFMQHNSSSSDDENYNSDEKCDDELADTVQDFTEKKIGSSTDPNLTSSSMQRRSKDGNFYSS